MNRLQKKCLIASTAIHVLLLIVLIVGPAFLPSKKDPNELPTLEFIPDLENVKVVDAPIFSGGNPQAQPPAPTPPVIQPQVAPAPVSTPPVEVVQPESETPKLLVSDVPDDKPKPRKPNISTELKKRPTDKPAQESKPPVQTASAKLPSQQMAEQVKRSVSTLRNNLSSSTEVDYRGPGGPAILNYAQIVKSRYEIAWQPPDDVASDDAVVKATVTISRSGKVINARVIGASGDPAVDKSVRDTLNRVEFIAPFPEGVREDERTFTINFNLKARRLQG